ncbi:hypothetical protein [Pseudosulfitobacter pseudonitzschiae]
MADLLRADFSESLYGRVIFPVARLRRLECVLEAHKLVVFVLLRIGMHPT